jgi:threonine aldolase
MRALSAFIHERNMFLHVDGARIANAAVSLGKSLRECTRSLGVDVLSFGATKNGGMGAEAVVFFNPTLAENFKFYRKQGMQLASKMRFLSAQFEALLKDDLWLRNAQHSNRMAQLLQRELSRIPQVKVVYPVESNGVFAKIPHQAIAQLQKRYFFYVWNEAQSLVRWMCSWDTTEEDVKQFVQYVREIVT